MKQHISQRPNGFSLLELSLVLMIVGFLVSGATVVGINQVEAARVRQTNEKMASIEKALFAHRRMYDRLPCPMDITLALTNANYGVAAANPGSCTGGTPAATLSSANLVAGGVPVRSLGLPDDYANDGWGRRFTFAVDRRMTGTNAYINYQMNDTTVGGFSVLDSTLGTPRTPGQPNGAVLVLVSHGKNGHGAYLGTGSSRYNAGSTNAAELMNCHCDVSATSTGLNGSFAMKDESVNVISSTDTFDDIVMYKMPWDYRFDDENVDNARLELIASSQAGGIETVLSYFGNANTGEFIQRSPVATLNPATGGARKKASSMDNKYIAMSSSGNGAYVMKVDGTTFTVLAGPLSCSGSHLNVDLSDDGRFLAVTSSNAPYLCLYKRVGDTFYSLSLPGTVPAMAIPSVTFSPYANYMALRMNASPFIQFYKRTGDDFTKLPDPAALGNVGDGTRFSHDGTLLAGCYTAAGGGAFIFSRSSDTFTRLADPAGSTISCQDLQWSSDDGWLAISSASTPYLQIWRHDGGGSLTKLTTGPDSNGLTVGLTAAPLDIAFSKSGDFLAISYATAPYLVVYKRNGNSLSPVSTPSPSPTATTAHVIFKQ